MTGDSIWQEFNRRLSKAGEVVGVETMKREEIAAVEWYRAQTASARQREQTVATVYAALLALAPDRASYDEAVTATDSIRQKLGGGT